MPEQGGQWSLRRATWEQDQQAILRIRFSVFVDEQHVPPELEEDSLDRACEHLLVTATDVQPIATARLCAGGHIGRMAVLPPWRSQGIGQAMLSALIELARDQGLHEVHLNAQTQAMGFYAARDFVATGDEYVDAGIPHRHMLRSMVKHPILAR